MFDPIAEVWLPGNVKCLGVDVDISINKISDEKVEKFVKSLDIGSINQIPNVPGVSRTITGSCIHDYGLAFAIASSLPATYLVQ